MFGAWALELVLITLRDLGVTLPGKLAFSSKGHAVNGLPLPADYLATFIIFAPLAALADTRARPLATTLAWGYVLATALNAIDATNPTAKPGSAAAKSTAQGGAQ